MPRPRQHEPEHVKRRLIAVFTERGYAGASFSDLAAATGLDRAQLSREYGDKRGLFLLALQEMDVIMRHAQLDRLAESGTAKDIRQLLMTMCQQADSPRGRLGCLMCNSARESVAAEDPEVSAVIRGHFRRVESSYRAALHNAIAAGEIGLPAGRTRQAARVLLGIHIALLVLLRAGESKALLREVATGALDALEL